MDNPELQKYMVAGMVAEELMNEQNNSFILTESGETIAAQPVYYRPDQRAVHKLIVESLLECSPGSPGITGLPGYGGQQKAPDPKIEKTKKMIQIIQDMMWRVSDTYYGTDNDESITKTVQDACNPLIRTMIQKLYDLWVLNNDGTKPEQPVQPEQPEQPPVAPNASSVVTTLTPVGGETPILNLSFGEGQTITSPQNKEYIIEAVVGDILKVREKATGARATVNIEIARKWKK